MVIVRATIHLGQIRLVRVLFNGGVLYYSYIFATVHEARQSREQWHGVINGPQNDPTPFI